MSITYGDHPQQNAEVTFPPGDGPAPLVLLFHGGFWRERTDREHLRPTAAELSRAGYVVANIEYRRVSGDGGYPETLIDAATAVDTLPDLIEQARPGSIDRAAVVTMGHSAGGHLAVWTAKRSLIAEDAPGYNANPTPLAAAISLAGAVDLTEAHRINAGSNAVGEFLLGSPTEVPERYAAADPTLIGKAPVPVVLIHGTKDEVVAVEMTRAYAARYGAELIELPDDGHMELIDFTSSAWPVVLDALARSVTPGT
jgi:acetyl esterase/lipase